MKQLLLIGTSHPEQIEEFYLKAFRQLGIEIQLFDLHAKLDPLLKNRFIAHASWPIHHHIVHHDLMRMYRSRRWDAVLVIKGYQLAASTIDACKRMRNVPWAVFNPDSPFALGRGATSRHIREAISHYDLYLIWSRALLAPLEAAGAKRTAYLPFGFDPETHFPAPPMDIDATLAHVISFVGTYDPQRAEVLTGLADLPLQVFGDGWDALPRNSPLRSRVTPRAARGAALRRIVSSSLVCLNIMREQNYSSHNMRTFEVPAMGGLMLTHRSAEQHEFFPEHESCLMYEGPGELRSRLLELLQDPSRSAALRSRALARAAGHTYLERARAILRHLEALA